MLLIFSCGHEHAEGDGHNHETETAQHSEDDGHNHGTEKEGLSEDDGHGHGEEHEEGEIHFAGGPSAVQTSRRLDCLDQGVLRTGCLAMCATFATTIMEAASSRLHNTEAIASGAGSTVVQGIVVDWKVTNKAIQPIPNAC